MQTRTYDELYDLIQALCGVSFSGIEAPRIKSLINRRANRAFRATNYWTRFLRIGEERTVTQGVIPFTQFGLDGIDTFLRIFPYEPYKRIGGGEYEFMVGASGAELLTGVFSPEVAWVTYKARKPTTYGTGVTDESAIPDEWFEYLAHGSYSDFLRAEGQQEKSALADQEANEILQDELMRLDEQHTQTIVANRIFTNANMQSRIGIVSAVGASDAVASDSTSQVSYESGEVIVTEG